MSECTPHPGFPRLSVNSFWVADGSIKSKTALQPCQNTSRSNCRGFVVISLPVGNQMDKFPKRSVVSGTGINHHVKFIRALKFFFGKIKSETAWCYYRCSVISNVLCGPSSTGWNKHFLRLSSSALTIAINSNLVLMSRFLTPSRKVFS